MSVSRLYDFFPGGITGWIGTQEIMVPRTAVGNRTSVELDTDGFYADGLDDTARPRAIAMAICPASLRYDPQGLDWV